VEIKTLLKCLLNLEGILKDHMCFYNYFTHLRENRNVFNGTQKILSIKEVVNKTEVEKKKRIVQKRKLSKGKITPSNVNGFFGAPDKRLLDESDIQTNTAFKTNLRSLSRTESKTKERKNSTKRPKSTTKSKKKKVSNTNLDRLFTFSQAPSHDQTYKNIKIPTFRNLNVESSPENRTLSPSDTIFQDSTLNEYLIINLIPPTEGTMP
jgi:hypothetical protein